ncbi:hypothetical protein QCA50_003851 [Cerrena zonata]|uniref:F-box domain-containing protein n=1 Tax=Cerrena zonata TaxID=2478898 RepID=A0AAW0GHR2_9APHY
MSSPNGGLANSETSLPVSTSTEVTGQPYSCTDTPVIAPDLNTSSLDSPDDHYPENVPPVRAVNALLESPSSNQTSLDMLSQTEENALGSAAAETPRVSYQSLPSELLLEIFRYATYVPRSRKLTPSDPFIPPHRGNGNVNTSAISTKNKIHLVLVCKEWRELANELLYEYVVISSLRRARLIARTLVHSGQRAFSDQRKDNSRGGHGQLVRHLEVHSSIRNSEKLPFLNEVASILLRCNNLLSFSGFWTYEVPSAFVDGVLRTTKNTLHGLSWTQPLFRFNYSGTTSEPIFTSKSLNSLQNLKVLELLEMPKHSHTSSSNWRDNLNESALAQITPPPLSQSGITLPNVSTLRLASVPTLLAFASTLSLPSLHTVIIDSSATYSDFSDFHPPLLSNMASSPLTYTLLQFLAAHGSSIHFLEVIPPRNRQRIRGETSNEPLDGRKAGYIPSPYPISPGLFLQPGACPNLQSLVFDCRERSMVYPISFELAVGLTGRQSNGRESVSPAPSDALDGTTPSPPPTLIFDTPLALPISSKPTLLTQRHGALRQIGIRGLDIARLYPSKPCHSQGHLLSLLNLKEGGNDMLPSLVKVQAIDFVVEESWDTNAKDIFIWWAERFDAVGTDLVDGECVLWLYDDEDYTPVPSEAQMKPTNRN